MGSAEELTHGDRVLELVSPHGGGPVLADLETASEHDLDHVDQVDFGLNHRGDALLQRFYLCGNPQSRPFLSHEVSLAGGPDLNSAGATQSVLLGLVM